MQISIGGKLIHIYPSTLSGERRTSGKKQIETEKLAALLVSTAVFKRGKNISNTPTTEEFVAINAAIKAYEADKRKMEKIMQVKLIAPRMTAWKLAAYILR
ncbi:hypothetical protein [Synergistes jonesii]|uniref:hypothetical protein n=1 Tax=Synergistes jonesii TaxID=2754 RepID=UPI0033276F2D